MMLLLTVPLLLFYVKEEKVLSFISFCFKKNNTSVE